MRYKNQQILFWIKQKFHMASCDLYNFSPDNVALFCMYSINNREIFSGLAESLSPYLNLIVPDFVIPNDLTEAEIIDSLLNQCLIYMNKSNCDQFIWLGNGPGISIGRMLSCIKYSPIIALIEDQLEIPRIELVEPMDCGLEYLAQTMQKQYPNNGYAYEEWLSFVLLHYQNEDILLERINWSEILAKENPNLAKLVLNNNSSNRLRLNYSEEETELIRQWINIKCTQEYKIRNRLGITCGT